MLTTMHEVSSILQSTSADDPRAAEQLLPLVYQELRKLAQSRLASESPGQSIQPTGLVHEAFLRLVDQDDVQVWNNRGHFFAAAAIAMQRILVERARRRSAARHGGGRQRETLRDIPQMRFEDDAQLLALDSSLNKLEEVRPDLANVIRLRYFSGLTMKQTAEAMGTSLRTANRHWSFAKAWLYSDLAAGETAEHAGGQPDERRS